MDDRALGTAGGEKVLEDGSAPERCVGEFAAVPDPGHDHVREQQVRLRGSKPTYGRRRMTGSRLSPAATNPR